MLPYGHWSMAILWQNIESYGVWTCWKCVVDEFLDKNNCWDQLRPVETPCPVALLPLFPAQLIMRLGVGLTVAAMLKGKMPRRRHRSWTLHYSKDLAGHDAYIHVWHCPMISGMKCLILADCISNKVSWNLLSGPKGWLRHLPTFAKSLPNPIDVSLRQPLELDFRIIATRDRFMGQNLLVAFDTKIIQDPSWKSPWMWQYHEKIWEKCWENTRINQWIWGLPDLSLRPTLCIVYCFCNSLPKMEDH